jgi:large subunit ribosomal protein L15
MMLNEVNDLAGGKPRRKRVGRGESSGRGRTSGRGNKGAGARAGYKSKRLYEGGQKALYSRFPKRGFSNFHFRTEYEIVNLGDLEAVFSAGARVDLAALRKVRLVQAPDALVKILGSGELTKKLTIIANAVSVAAKAAIEKAGGTIEVIAALDRAAAAKTKRKTAKGKKRVEFDRLAKKKAASPAGA